MATLIQQEGYKCEFQESVPEHFYCKKCSLVAKKIMLTSCCGETYCNGCLYNGNDVDISCPACGQKKITTIHPLKYQRQIEQLKAFCTNKGRGCDWMGTVGMLYSHLDPLKNKCQYMDIQCPLNCKRVIPRNAMEEHLKKDCSNRLYACQYCSYSATYKEVVDLHLPKCKHVVLKCPNVCGMSCERGLLENHLKDCPLESISCQFKEIGCENRFQRMELEKHIEQNSFKHITLIASACKFMSKQNTEKIEDTQQMINVREMEIVHQKEVLKEHDKKHKEIELKMSAMEKKIQLQDVMLNCLKQKLAHQDQRWQEKEEEFQRMLHEQRKISDEAVMNSLTEIGLKLRRMFVLNNFSKEKQKQDDEDWKSPPMYTHFCGYKFCIGIDANGVGAAQGKALSASVWSMKGEYDDQLKWPIPVTFSLEVVSQNKSVNNVKKYSKVASWERHTKDFRDRYWFTSESSAPDDINYYSFLEYTSLQNFTNSDTLVFNVEVMMS